MTGNGEEPFNIASMRRQMLTMPRLRRTSLLLSWAHVLLGTARRVWGQRPLIHFCFDAGSAAGVVFGACNSPDPLCLKAMALMQTVQVAHEITVIPHYTKAHAGNPGNEAADMHSDCKLA